MFTKQFKKLRFVAFLVLLFSSKIFAQSDEPQKVNLIIKEWLNAGPTEVVLPAFNNVKNIKGKTFEVADLIRFTYKEFSNVSLGDIFLDKSGKKIFWTKEKVGRDDEFAVKPSSKERFEMNWQAVYIEVDQFCEIKIEIETSQYFELFIDQKKKLSKYKYTAASNNPIKKSTSIKFETGKHLLVLKSLFTADSAAKWNIKTTMSVNSEEVSKGISISLIPEQNMDIDHLLLGKRLKSVSLSPNSTYLISRYSETSPPDGKTNNWFDVKEISTQKTVFTSKHAEIKDVSWVPTGNRISYKTKYGKSSSLVIFDLDTFTEKVILEDQKDLSSYTWSNDGGFIIYSITEKAKKDKTGVTKLEGMPDRWPWWQSRSQLYKLNISDKSIQKLTHGYLYNNLQDISPDNEKILISQNRPEFSERPYSKQILIETNLGDLSIDTIWSNNFDGSVSYSPDGKFLLVTGSPVLFGQIGINLPAGMIPNDYDTQAYIYNLETAEVKSITKNFDPKIEDAEWNKFDNQIYFIVQERTYKKIYSFNPEDETFNDLGAKVDVVKNFSFATSKPIMAYTGNSISSPKTAHLYNLRSKEQELIENPEKGFFADIKFGKNEDWNFENTDGKKIEGRIYYPPDFDPDKTYPLIVYYYSGTNPTDRSFRGRYPKNLYAAMGYVVYNLQPSGATGYGQEFAASHVNNWGITVADEIITGTKLFLEDHPFIDPDKVGCIGASYGGFMTMLLTTRTDIFSAAISHAGISSISSYWGQGYWGYLYSSVASANSFPWNNKDLYIEQSPLFNADKVTTPLLLLTGDADTNVPPGESIQMYTALKLLGKTVELVEIEGQNHHILDYKKRILWQKTIFAWFDKWLKGQDGWWNNLYPEKNL